MSLLHPERETVRVHFAEGGEKSWVDIYKVIPHGVAREAQKRAMQGRVTPAKNGKNGAAATPDAFGDEAEDSSVVIVNTAVFHSILLEKMIVAWSDEDLPISRTTIDQLPEQIAQRIIEEINKYNRTRTEEDARPLESSSSTPSATPEEPGTSSAVSTGQES